jgi:N-acetylglucosaminyl-diphospho-decaprenol L-rhamnosyltransferase
MSAQSTSCLDPTNRCDYKKSSQSEAELLDESYRLHYEKADFSLQACLASWLCWYAPSGRVVHRVDQRSDVANLDNTPKRTTRCWFDSRPRCYYINNDLVFMLVNNPPWLFRYSFWRARIGLERKPDQIPNFLVRDFVLYRFFLLQLRGK